MGYIYAITNVINNKSYIGKTMKSNPEERFREHLSEALKDRRSHRALYKAINKYGADNFKFTVIEECDNDILSEREAYHIRVNRTYHFGYNETIGGDGKPYVDREKILSTYKKTFNAEETAKICKVHPVTVRTVVTEVGFPLIPLDIQSRPIMGQSVENGKLYLFQSILAASKFIYYNKYGYETCDYNNKKFTNMICGYGSHIRRALNTSGYYHQYTWKLVPRYEYCSIVSNLIDNGNTEVIREVYGMVIVELANT